MVYDNKVVATAFKVLLLATVYYLTGYWGLYVESTAKFATLVWAPSGISLAILFLGGVRLWPGVFLGALLVNASEGAPLLVASGIAVGNTLEGLAAVYLLKRFDFSPLMVRVKDVLILVGYAGVVAPVASATVGVLSLSLGGLVDFSQAPVAWAMWWLGDLMSNIVVAPAILLWMRGGPRRLSWARFFESILLGTGLCVVAVLAYYREVFPFNTGLYYLLRPHTLFPFLVWGCLRFGPRGAATCISLVLGISLLSILDGYGPVAGASRITNLLFSQYFLVVAAITAYILAAVVKTQQATQMALRAAKQIADKASLAKSTFLANMSHEIRTPLSVILGFTDFLLDPNQSIEERRESALTIKRNGELLLHLVEDILDLSKIEAGRLIVEKLRFSLTPLIHDLETFFQFKAEEKGIELVIDLQGLVDPWVVSDPTRIKQILINVVGNAIKFTDKGSVHLCARNVGAEGERKIIFEVRDTGTGIAPEQSSSLFQSFVQADSSTTRRFGGTGLGLVLARTLARALGGDLVLVKSQVGVGSLFQISMDAGPKSLSPELSSKPLLQTEVKGNLAGMRLLLVEDAPDNRLLAKRLLETSGAVVDVAVDGQEGVAKASVTYYDVILMDLQMPGIDGYQATSLLRGKGYSGPIVALTANALADSREKCLEGGFNAHLTKPINPVFLVQTLRLWTPADPAVVPPGESGTLLNPC